MIASFSRVLKVVSILLFAALSGCNNKPAQNSSESEAQSMMIKLIDQNGSLIHQVSDPEAFTFLASQIQDRQIMKEKIMPLLDLRIEIIEANKTTRYQYAKGGYLRLDEPEKTQIFKVTEVKQFYQLLNGK
ncbi:MAG: hypothetical protein OQK51_07405 [Kangiellaceae bacterium]|nr:hypothetical protein [Kangiellaceae bacterium]